MDDAVAGRLSATFVVPQPLAAPMLPNTWNSNSE